MTERTSHTITSVDEVECPWHRGNAAHNLVVHQVAHTHKSSGNGNGDAQPVEQPQHIHLVLVGEINDKEDDGYHRAMTCKTLITNKVPIFIYRQQHLQRMGNQVFGLVKEEMAQAQAYDGPHDSPDGQPVEQLLRQVFGLEDFLQRQISQKEACGQQNAVPAHFKRAKRECHRIDGPCNVGEGVHGDGGMGDEVKSEK